MKTSATNDISAVRQEAPSRMSSISAIASDRTQSIISDITGEGSRQEGTRRYTRSPEDVLRLIVFGIVYIALSYTFAMRADRIIGHEAHLGGAVAGIVATLLVRPETWGEFTAKVAERAAMYLG